MNIENKEENMTYYLYTGTYTGGMHSDLEVTGSKGIYIYRMDEETNKLHPLGVFGGDEIDPAFLAIKDNLLFAENERKDYQVIRSYRIHEDGSLSLADAVNAKGEWFPHNRYSIRVIAWCPAVRKALMHIRPGILRMEREFWCRI